MFIPIFWCHLLIYCLTSHPPRLYAVLVKQTLGVRSTLACLLPQDEEDASHHPGHRDLISTMAMICWSQVLPAHKWHHISSLKSASVEIFTPQKLANIANQTLPTVPVKSQLTGTLVDVGKTRNTVLQT